MGDGYRAARKAGGVSRVDELQRLSAGESWIHAEPDGALVRYADAARVIRELGAKVAEQESAIRDRMIACLQDSERKAIAEARAEVPEWSRPILTAALRWYRHRQRDARATHEAVVDLEAAVREALDRLSECGIGGAR